MIRNRTRRRLTSVHMESGENPLPPPALLDGPEPPLSMPSSRRTARAVVPSAQGTFSSSNDFDWTTYGERGA